LPPTRNGLDVAPAAFPVSPGHPPAPAAEAGAAGAIGLLGEQHRVRSARPPAGRQHGELRGGAGEHRRMPMKCRYRTAARPQGPMNSSSPSWSTNPRSTRCRRIGSALRSNGASPFHACHPEPAADPVFLQAHGQQLLGRTMCRGSGGATTGSTYPWPHRCSNPAAHSNGPVPSVKEQAVPAAPGPPSGPSGALQERRHARRVVEPGMTRSRVAHVDPELPASRSPR